jgi:hypothetical protein
MEFITATVPQREASIALADCRELGGQVARESDGAASARP